MYRPMELDITEPEAVAYTGDQPLHEPSGMEVLPVRVLISMLVFAGIVAFHEINCHCSVYPPSKTLDMNVPSVS